MSTRPKEYGGPLVHSVTKCKTYTQVEPGVASSPWQCDLDLPNSFAPDDGLRLEVSGQASTKEAASEITCHLAMALLLNANPSQVVLRPKHWNISIDALVAGLPQADAVPQALPVHARGANRNNDGADAPLSPADVESQVSDLIQRCLKAHGGSFDPSHINNRAVGIGPGEERVHSVLDRLLQPGELREFIDRHPDFQWCRSGVHMYITWASFASASSQDPAGVAPSFASASSQDPAGVAPSFASASSQEPKSYYTTLSNHSSQGIPSTLPPLDAKATAPNLLHNPTPAIAASMASVPNPLPSQVTSMALVPPPPPPPMPTITNWRQPPNIPPPTDGIARKRPPPHPAQAKATDQYPVGSIQNPRMPPKAPPAPEELAAHAARIAASSSSAAAATDEEIAAELKESISSTLDTLRPLINDGSIPAEKTRADIEAEIAAIDLFLGQALPATSAMASRNEA